MRSRNYSNDPLRSVGIRGEYVYIEHRMPEFRQNGGRRNATSQISDGVVLLASISRRGHQCSVFVALLFFIYK
jgi:hypothetical protein